MSEAFVGTSPIVDEPVFNQNAAKKPRRSYMLLVLLLAATSIASFFYFFLRSEILLCGDAVAHINIARRIFDSRTPGPLQLGTVWLPLPHVLSIPFLISEWLWRTGVGGSVISMIAYVWGAIGIFRLVRARSRYVASAWLAVFIFAANPNLIYLQSTAMTEPLSMAFSVWAVAFASEYEKGISEHSIHGRRLAGATSLELSGLCLAGAMLTRYDGWFLAIFISAFVLITYWKHNAMMNGDLRKRSRRSLCNFILLTAIAPVYWLAYNYVVYQNALEFMNGPYSAHAIEQRSAQQGNSPHPGSHQLIIAAQYYGMSAELNVGERAWQRAGTWLALAGLLLVAIVGSGYRVWILLWVPLLFYSLAIAYGGVPIFMPAWWPHSYYNVRYGLQMLPAIAVFAAAAWEISFGWMNLSKSKFAYVIIFVFVAMIYFFAWEDTPITLREAQVNSATRIVFEKKLAGNLSMLPAESSLLMFTGNHVGALQRADIHLSRTINEGNYGLWQAALADPSHKADYVVAMQGDPVWKSAQSHLRELIPVATVNTPGQPEAVIYRTKAATSR